ncbi:MAG: hypothetical protein L3K23_06405 [Thermoplasmata archaeon]|nr:hypothetical protein [Thermoplasmata archaeon]
MGDEGWDPPSTARSPPQLPLDKVVPARAVLTELARGFLLVNDTDRRQAARFAATFLKERIAEGESTKASPPRRGPTRTHGGPDAPALR